MRDATLFWRLLPAMLALGMLSAMVGVAGSGGVGLLKWRLDPLLLFMLIIASVGGLGFLASAWGLLPA